MSLSTLNVVPENRGRNHSFILSMFSSLGGICISIGLEGVVAGAGCRASSADVICAAAGCLGVFSVARACEGAELTRFPPTDPTLGSWFGNDLCTSLSSLHAVNDKKHLFADGTK